MEQLIGTLQSVGTLSGKLTVPTGSLPPEYPGPYAITPGEAAQTLETNGRIMTDDVVISGDAALLPENIKDGLTIFGVAGYLVVTEAVQDPQTGVLTIM